MIYQYLNAAFRFFRKKWALTSLNILIFGIGVAASILILKKVSYEYSYDTFHTNHENIYRVSHDHYYPYDVYQNSTATSFYPLGYELKDQYPEVKEFTKVTSKFSNSTIKVDDKTFREDDVYVINPSFFNVFTVEMIHGDTSNTARFDVFLSESLATKLFQETDVVGSSIDLWDGNILKVKGVYRDVPDNSHFKYDLLAVTLHDTDRDNWQNYGYHTYIVLNDGVNGKAFEEKLIPFSEKFSKISDQQSNVDYRWEIKLQPLSSIHLNSDLDIEHETNGSSQNVNLLLIMGIFIIIISCFNFVNLTNSMYAKRFSEFFLRKLHGASMVHLLKQYAFESFVLLCIGFLASALVLFMLPYFSDYSVSQSVQTRFYWGLVIVVMISLTLTVILPSSAFALINPLKFTKGQNASNSLVKGLGKSLIVVQFVVSFLLIAAALTINNQLDFIIKKNPGVNVSDVITVDLPGLYYPNRKGDLNKMKLDLEKQAGIQSVSFSDVVPGRGYNNDGSFRFIEDPSDKAKLNYYQFVSSEYFDTYELEILEGRVFDEQRQADSLSIVINETMAKELEAENYEDLIGRKVNMPYGTSYGDFEIVGIAKDYYHESLKETIVPCAFISMTFGGNVNKISIRLNESDSDTRLESVAAIKQTFEGLFSHTFESSIVEDNYSGQFDTYADFADLIKALSVLAIIMAGIGLFGLASNETAKRTKEVAIRKVNGARILDIYLLFSKYFVKLIGLAFIISLPISIHFAEDWLDNFAVKVEIGAWFIAPQLLLTTVVGLISISYYLIKVALQNPVVILKNNE